MKIEFEVIKEWYTPLMGRIKIIWETSDNYIVLQEKFVPKNIVHESREKFLEYINPKSDAK